MPGIVIIEYITQLSKEGVIAKKHSPIGSTVTHGINWSFHDLLHIVFKMVVVAKKKRGLKRALYLPLPSHTSSAMKTFHGCVAERNLFQETFAN